MYAFVRGKVASNEVWKSNTEEEKGFVAECFEFWDEPFYSRGGERRNFMIHLIFLYMDT